MGGQCAGILPHSRFTNQSHNLVLYQETSSSYEWAIRLDLSFCSAILNSPTCSYSVTRSLRLFVEILYQLRASGLDSVLLASVLRSRYCSI